MKEDLFLSRAEFVRQSDEIKRRQKRLQEAREQSKKTTAAVLDLIKSKAENQYRITENRLLSEIRDQQAKELADVRKGYEQCVYGINRKCYDELMCDRNKITTSAIREVPVLKKQRDVNRANELQSPDLSQVPRASMNHSRRKTTREVNKMKSNLKSVENIQLPQNIVVDSDNDAPAEVHCADGFSNTRLVSKNRLNVMYTRLVHDRIRILEQKEKVLRRRIPTLRNPNTIAKRQKPSRYYEHLLDGHMGSDTREFIGNQHVKNNEKHKQLPSQIAPVSRSYSTSVSSSPTNTERKKDDYSVIKDLKRVHVKKKLLASELVDKSKTTTTAVSTTNKGKDCLENGIGNLCENPNEHHIDTQSALNSCRNNEDIEQSLKRNNRSVAITTEKSDAGVEGAEKARFNAVHDDMTRCDKWSRVQNDRFSSGNEENPNGKSMRKHSQTCVRKTRDIVVTVCANKRCDDVIAIKNNENCMPIGQIDGIVRFSSSSSGSPNDSDNSRPNEHIKNIKVTVNVLTGDERKEHKIRRRMCHEREKHFQRGKNKSSTAKVSNWKAVFENNEKLTESSYFSPPSCLSLPRLSVSENIESDVASTNYGRDDCNEKDASSADDIGYYVAKLLLMSPESIENLDAFSVVSQSEDTNEKVVAEAGIYDDHNDCIEDVLVHHYQHNDNNRTAMCSRKVFSRMTQTDFGRHGDSETKTKPRKPGHVSYTCDDNHDSGDGSNVGAAESELDVSEKSATIRSLLFQYLQAAAHNRFSASSVHSHPALAVDEELSPQHSPRRPRKNVEKRQSSTGKMRKCIHQKHLFPKKELAYYANSFEDQFEVSSSASRAVSVLDVSSSSTVDETNTNFKPTLRSKANNENQDDSTGEVTRSCAAAVTVGTIAVTSTTTHTVSTTANTNTTTTTATTITTTVGTNHQSNIVEESLTAKYATKLYSPAHITLEDSNVEGQDISLPSIEALLERGIIPVDIVLDKSLAAASNSATFHESDEIFDEEEFMREILGVNIRSDRDFTADINIDAATATSDVPAPVGESLSTNKNTLAGTGSQNAAEPSVTSELSPNRATSIYNDDDRFIGGMLSSLDDMKRKSRLLRWMGSTMQRTLEASIVNSSSSFEEFADAVGGHIPKT